MSWEIFLEHEYFHDEGTKGKDPDLQATDKTCSHTSFQREETCCRSPSMRGQAWGQKGGLGWGLASSLPQAPPRRTVQSAVGWMAEF